MEEFEQEKQEVTKMVEEASPERLDTIRVLLSLSDSDALAYGEAFSLLKESNFNIATLKEAIGRVRDEQGLNIVRTRTRVRVFKFLKDEDNPDDGFLYRAFYVNIITPEQKIALQSDAAGKLKMVINKGVSDKDLRSDPTKILDILQSEDFIQAITDPSKVMRQIILNNLVEVQVEDDGRVSKPIMELSYSEDFPESILQTLEEDLRILLDQQGILVKNLSTTDMLGI